MIPHGLRALALVFCGCVTVQPITPPAPVLAPARAEDPVRAALRSFLAAARASQFEAAFECVSEKWHRRYASAAAFGDDLAREPMAAERLAQVERSLEGPVQVAGTRATLGLGDGRVIVLTRQGERWVIDELDARK